MATDTECLPLGESSKTNLNSTVSSSSRASNKFFQSAQRVREREANDGRVKARSMEELCRAHEEKCVEIEGKRGVKLEHLEERIEQELQGHDDHVNMMTRRLVLHHQQTRADHLEKLRNEVEPKAPRWSAEVLRLRKLSDTFMRSGRHMDAFTQKLKAEQLETLERAAWAEDREKKIKTLDDRLLAHQKEEKDRQKEHFEYLRRQIVHGHKVDREKENKLWNTKGTAANNAYHAEIRIRDEHVVTRGADAMVLR